MHLLAKFVLAFGRVVYNLLSVRLWFAIICVVVVTHVVKNILFGLGLVIGDIAEFTEKVVATILDVINAIANGASKVEHGFQDFFTFHYDRLSHEGDYAAHIHLTPPPILSQLATLKRDIDQSRKWPLGQALVEMIQLVGQVPVCPTLAYFRRISLSRWVVNGIVDVSLPGLCRNGESKGVQVVMFIFDGLPELLGWIGTTGVVLWLVMVEGWPLIRWSLVAIFEIVGMTLTRVRICTRFQKTAPEERKKGSDKYSL